MTVDRLAGFVAGMQLYGKPGVAIQYFEHDVQVVAFQESGQRDAVQSVELNARYAFVVQAGLPGFRHFLINGRQFLGAPDAVATPGIVLLIGFQQVGDVPGQGCFEHCILLALTRPDFLQHFYFILIQVFLLFDGHKTRRDALLIGFYFHARAGDLLGDLVNIPFELKGFLQGILCCGIAADLRCGTERKLVRGKEMQLLKLCF